MFILLTVTIQGQTRTTQARGVALLRVIFQVPDLSFLLSFLISLVAAESPLHVFFCCFFLFFSLACEPCHRLERRKDARKKNVASYYHFCFCFIRNSLVTWPSPAAGEAGKCSLWWGSLTPIWTPGAVLLRKRGEGGWILRGIGKHTGSGKVLDKEIIKFQPLCPSCVCFCLWCFILSCRVTQCVKWNGSF